MKNLTPKTRAISMNPEKKETLPILFALVVAIVPHVPDLAVWINLWCLTMWGYILVRFKTGWPLPPAWIRHCLTFSAVAGLLIFFRFRIGADAFVGLMALMAAIKPFEMPTHRHRMITLLLTYFMIITSLFRSDALFTMIYMLFSVFVTTLSLVKINWPESSIKQSRNLAGSILARALAVLLFMVFPRLPDSLFGFQDPSKGKSGFSDRLEPGHISSLEKGYKTDSAPAEPQKTDPVTKMQRQILLNGKSLNPRTRQLARNLGKTTDNPRDTATKILAYFKKNKFVYSLTPPLLGDHPIDSFIFDTQKGYCGHYASATAFMLNEAGIPARVVGGYLGGEFNPYGNYLIVRQSYAHAWVEYFDKDWIRMDPTGAVAPQRLFTNPDGSLVRPGSGASALNLLSRIRFAMDAANLEWESWFTGYSYFKQKAWLTTLGLVRGNQATGLVLILLTLSVAGIVFSVLAWQFSRSHPPLDPIKHTMNQFYKKLSKIGLVPPPGQEPKTFSDLCIKKRPDLCLEIQLIMDLYSGLRYTKECDDASLEKFQSQVKRFRPKTKETL
ncbi:MAG: DUF3488 domain-containing transglutaminase family protein [Desulfobacter sp.]|nr:DUF3488 domain-containing transglutaminase family protein [Desulfobacter sp.]